MFSPGDKYWSPESAANAYFDTIELCKLGNNMITSASAAPHSTEFIAALAAGIEANLIVEVASRASLSTIALAVAARQTGGRLICILSKSEALLDAMLATNNLGLSKVIEFIVGDAEDILPQYANIDFALIDCTETHNAEFFDILQFNPTRAVIVVEKLHERKVRAAYGNFVNNRIGAKSISLPIGNGIEVTRLCREEENKVEVDSGRRRHMKRVSWAMDVDNTSF